MQMELEKRDDIFVNVSGGRLYDQADEKADPALCSVIRYSMYMGCQPREAQWSKIWPPITLHHPRQERGKHREELQH